MLYCDASKGGQPLRLDVYQHQARNADQSRKTGAQGLRIPLLGLFGEAGSLLTQLKRTQREKATFSPYYAAVVEEMGDVLWYLSNLASRHRVELSTLALAAKSLPGGIRPKPRPALTFGTLQKGRGRRQWRDRVTRMSEEHFFAFGGVVGRVMSDFASGSRQGLDRQEFLILLSRTFHLLVQAANSAGVSLNLVAHNNLAKIESRWPRKPGRVFERPFDEKRDNDEQLPRRLVVRFVERTINGKTYVYQLCRGINIGSRLTDNRRKRDDYRFHDVFHLAYMAVLGWSPVIRALLQLKRKRDPEIDENEDGARAILIEEGIATWIFNHGSQHADFRQTRSLDYSLLKAVRQLVTGYEVETRALWQWEAAIMQGFKVFRALKKYRKGWVIADMRRHSITFRRTPPVLQ